MNSSEGEVLNFRTQVVAEGAVEHWMTAVLAEMRASLHIIMKEAVFHYPKMNRIKWIDANLGSDPSLSPNKRPETLDHAQLRLREHIFSIPFALRTFQTVHECDAGFLCVQDVRQWRQPVVVDVAGRRWVPEGQSRREARCQEPQPAAFAPGLLPDLWTLT
eukprot:294642-Rhodomonas_salina.3